MKYRLLYRQDSLKDLKKLDKFTQKLIINYMKNIEKLDEPRSKGKALSSNLRGFWRYRVADYRVICEINDDELIIIAIHIGHRKEIYKKL